MLCAWLTVSTAFSTEKASMKALWLLEALILFALSEPGGMNGRLRGTNVTVSGSSVHTTPTPPPNGCGALQGATLFSHGLQRVETWRMS